MGEKMKPFAAQLKDTVSSLQVSQRNLFEAVGDLIREHTGIPACPVTAATARRCVLLLHRKPIGTVTESGGIPQKRICPSPT